MIKHYLEHSVVDESKRRISHVFDIFDTVAVMFNGSLDSLAVLLLTQEVSPRTPVLAIYRDEEIVPECMVEYLQLFRGGGIQLDWYVVPYISDMYVLGQVHTYKQWDPDRPSIRTPPSWAIEEHGGAFSETSFLALIGARYPGKIALLDGVRATEGIARYRSSVVKLNENYITATSGVPDVLGVRPIFDWSRDDVLAYLSGREAPISSLYTYQLWAGDKQRASVAPYGESAKSYEHLREVDPQLYERLIESLPALEAQALFGSQVDDEWLVDRYGSTIEGVKDWIEAHITHPRDKIAARMRFGAIANRCRKSPGLYPPSYVLRYFMRGAYSENLPPFERARPAGDPG